MSKPDQLLGTYRTGKDQVFSTTTSAENVGDPVTQCNKIEKGVIQYEDQQILKGSYE